MRPRPADLLACVVLTALLLGFRISKSAQTSNWDSDQLNEKQISYAATDAWVCLKIYDILKPR